MDEVKWRAKMTAMKMLLLLRFVSGRTRCRRLRVDGNRAWDVIHIDYWENEGEHHHILNHSSYRSIPKPTCFVQSTATDSVLSLPQPWSDREQQEPLVILAVLGTDQIHAAPALECTTSIHGLQVPIAAMFLDAPSH